jgi:hypothetical protein
MIWDPGGFQHLRWEAHEQELMNFAAKEYDEGASLHVSQSCQARAFKMKRGTSIIF